MITREKLSIYKKYGGDDDGFSRGGTAPEKQAISDEEWSQIRREVQAIEALERMA